MNKKAFFIGSATLLSSLVAFQSFSNPTPLNSVQKCASLLPSGYNFSMTINAKIDTTTDKPVVSGILDLTDGTEILPPELSSKVEPFIQCVVKLMK